MFQFVYVELIKIVHILIFSIQLYSSNLILSCFMPVIWFFPAETENL